MRIQSIQNELEDRKPHLQYIKTYVPIFPFMYQTLTKGQDLGDKKKVQLKDSHIMLKPNSSNQFELVYPKLQLQFSLRYNKLLKYEESRQEELE